MFKRIADPTLISADPPHDKQKIAACKLVLSFFIFLPKEFDKLGDIKSCTLKHKCKINALSVWIWLSQNLQNARINLPNIVDAFENKGIINDDGRCLRNFIFSFQGIEQGFVFVNLIEGEDEYLIFETFANFI